jgi:hypothetical protein
VRAFGLAWEVGVVPGRLNRVRHDQSPLERQRRQQWPEMRDLVGLPDLATLA